MRIQTYKKATHFPYVFVSYYLFSNLRPSVVNVKNTKYVSCNYLHNFFYSFVFDLIYFKRYLKYTLETVEIISYVLKTFLL